jgi:hypothetical protein
MSGLSLHYVDAPVTIDTRNDMFTVTITSGEEQYRFILTRHALTSLMARAKVNIAAANAKSHIADMNVVSIKPKKKVRRQRHG